MYINYIVNYIVNTDILLLLKYIYLEYNRLSLQRRDLNETPAETPAEKDARAAKNRGTSVFQFIHKSAYINYIVNTDMLLLLKYIYLEYNRLSYQRRNSTPSRKEREETVADENVETVNNALRSGI